MGKRVSLAVIGVIILAAFDQIVKYIINSSFVVGESHPVIKDVFHITYVQNKGAAWGSFSGRRIFLLAVTVIVAVFVVWAYLKLAKASARSFTPLRISLVVLFAGAIGNMIDRVARGYVVDMFDFCLINFPVFNVADIYVTCSFIIIALLVLFKYKDDELEAVFRKNN
jgi:signal peptidase II